MITNSKLLSIKKDLRDKYGDSVDIDYTRGDYHNQFKVSIHIKGRYLNFQIIETGECGVLKFQQFIYTCETIVEDNDFMEKYFYIFKLFMQELNRNCIAYYAFLGDFHKPVYEQLLLNLGFDVLSEYRNAQHDPEYKQRLYFLNTEQKWK